MNMISGRFAALCLLGVVTAFAAVADAQEQDRPAVGTSADFFDGVAVLGEAGIPGTMRPMTRRDITEAQFLRYARAYRSGIDPDPARVQIDVAGNRFSFPIRKGRVVYPMEAPIMGFDEDGNMYGLDAEGRRIEEGYECRDRRWVEYVGYIDALSLYVLDGRTSSSECLGFGDLFMIDADSNRQWNMPSYNSDGGMSGPLVSPGRRYLAVYQADPLSDPLIEVMRIGLEDGHRAYREHAYFWLENSKRQIQELVWIDDTRLALKIGPEWTPDADEGGSSSHWELSLPDERSGE